MMRVDNYPKQHWDGCMCEACDDLFGRHNPDRNGPICSCTGCRTRDAARKNNRTQPTKQYNNQGRTKTVATVNFCERCNTMGKSSAMGRLTFWTGQDDMAEKHIEICPGCVEDMVAFLKWEDGQAERPKSYSEAYSEHESDPLAGLSDDELARAYLARVAAQQGVLALESRDDGTV